MKKIIKNKIILIVILCIISCGIGVYAATTYKASDVVYNASDGTSMNVNEALNELYNNCKSGISSFRIGDYIKMTPTNTSYTIPSTITGHGDQTINPSELNLWRVIRNNSDGTIDMVSEYVSSKEVQFTGLKGYLNLVGGLNLIAKQYENSNYTISSRHTGYFKQTETITNTSKINQTSAPWTVNTTDNSNESLGGGDINYMIDLSLIYYATGRFNAYKVGTTTQTSYWLASRNFRYNWSQVWYFQGRYVDNNANHEAIYYYNQGTFYNNELLNISIRPIVTLKAGLKSSSGDGTLNNPYILK